MATIDHGGTVLDGAQLAALDGLLAALGLEKPNTAWVHIGGVPGGLRITAAVAAVRGVKVLVWRSP